MEGLIKNESLKCNVYAYVKRLDDIHIFIPFYNFNDQF